jgi:UDP-N-acetylglucosamine transferase subunit ALG13
MSQDGVTNILVTVGTQLPFDRLIRAMDQWAGGPVAKACGAQVFAQIGPTNYRPAIMEFAQFITADEFRRRVESADLVVAHAGMGSIITALELGKPILVMPRSASLNEHRNEHQMATARHFREQGRINVAENEIELLEKLINLGQIRATGAISRFASPKLISVLREFVANGGCSEHLGDSSLVKMDLGPSHLGAGSESALSGRL